MTDAVREQIRRDAAKFFRQTVSCGVTHAFAQGATHQHPISFEAGRKEGWNEAIDKIIADKKNLRDHNLNQRDTYGTYTDGWLEHNRIAVFLEIEIKQFETEIKK